jgi:hypothetical protein
LRANLQIADRHVLDHAAAQRAHLGHRGLLSKVLRGALEKRAKTMRAIEAMPCGFDLTRWGGGSSFVPIEKSASAKSARDIQR